MLSIYGAVKRLQEAGESGILCTYRTRLHNMGLTGRGGKRKHIGANKGKG